MSEVLEVLFQVYGNDGSWMNLLVLLRYLHAVAAVRPRLLLCFLENLMLLLLRPPVTTTMMMMMMSRTMTATTTTTRRIREK